MMKAIFLTAALAVAAGCGTTSQGYVYASGGTYAHRADVVPAGSVLVVRLDQHLSAGRMTPGQPVYGRTIGDLRGYDGELLVPRGSYVMGRIVGRRGYGMGAEVAIRFETIQMGGVNQRLGETVAIRGALPRGSRLEIQLDRPIRSYAALRGRYY
jgi:hypothetical protein